MRPPSPVLPWTPSFSNFAMSNISRPSNFMDMLILCLQKYFFNPSPQEDLPQKQKLDIAIIKVLHATIKKRLEQKVIDPKKHIEEKNYKNVEERKKKTRELHKNNPEVPMMPVTTIDTENVQTTTTHDATEESTKLDQKNTPVDDFEDIFGASDKLDISVETDSDGRRILPSRCGTSSPTNPCWIDLLLPHH